MPSIIKQYYHDISLNKNQLLFSRLHNVTTAQRIAIGATLTSSDKGFIVYDTDLSSSYEWDGTVWVISTASVTSVGLSMPPAFTVLGSPVTTSGVIQVDGAGSASQYIRGDGELSNFPSTGGGSVASYYLNGSVNQGVFVGDTYYEMNKVPVIPPNTDFTIAAPGYVASFITDPLDPSIINIPAGAWTFNLYFSADSAGGTPSFYVELYEYDGVNFTLIADNSATPEFITNGTDIDLYSTNLTVPNTPLNILDRLAVRVYVNTSGKTITLHTQDQHLCKIDTTFTTGITALNGINDQVQFMVTGTLGTDFSINSAVGGIHTFNLPIASAVNTGKLTSTDWSIFNNKIGGLGTSGYVSKFTGGSTIGDSVIYESGSNIGIGTTTPDIFSAGYSGTILGVSSTIGNSAIEINGNTNSYFDMGGGGTKRFSIQSFSGYTLIDGVGSTAIRFRINSNEKLAVTSLGVGIGTTIPAATLDVFGNVNISTILNAAIDTDRFLVSDSGIIKYRTGAQVLSDIGGQPVLTNPVTGTGTLNRIPKWTPSGSQLGDSLLLDNGTQLRANLSGTDNGIFLDLTAHDYRIGRLVGAGQAFLQVQTNLARFINNSLSNGLDFDFAGSVFKLGYLPFNRQIVIDGLNGAIYTQFGAFNEGLYIDFNSKEYWLGVPSDGYGVVVNSSVLSPAITIGDPAGVFGGGVMVFNPSLESIYTQYAGSLEGLNVDFITRVYELGDFDATLNSTYLQIDDTNRVSTFSGRVSQINLGETTAFGFEAGLSDDLSTNANTFIGHQSGRLTTTGIDNVAVGRSSLPANTTGSENTAIGRSALANSNNTGNTAVGRSALASATSGSNNTGIGRNALSALTTASNNVALGWDAGKLVTAGSNNTTSNNSLYLGVDTRASLNGNTNEIVIGYQARGNGSNTVTLGNTSILTTVLQGAVGIATTAPARSLHVGSLGILTPNVRLSGPSANNGYSGYLEITSNNVTSINYQIYAKSTGFITSTTGAQGIWNFGYSGGAGIEATISGKILASSLGFFIRGETGLDLNLGSNNTNNRLIIKSATGNILINTTVEDASAKVKIDSTTQGFLMPRMTGLQAEAILTPADGLLVYISSGDGVTITSTGWWGRDAGVWVKLN
jgi:hypothetical protein